MEFMLECKMCTTKDLIHLISSNKVRKYNMFVVKFTLKICGNKSVDMRVEKITFYKHRKKFNTKV